MILRWLFQYKRYPTITWWRHQMETFSALLAICAKNSPVTCEFPAKRPVTRSFSLICAWMNIHEAGDLRRHRAHYDVIVMSVTSLWWWGDRTWPSCFCIRNSFQTGILRWHHIETIMALFQYKDRLSEYEHCHYEDKTVLWPPYSYNGNFYTVGAASL